jgi:hypothetical protein
MNILGFNIQLLLLLQLLFTATVITIYAVLTSMQEAKARQLSDSHMIILIDFVTKHHPELKTIFQITESKREDSGGSGTEVYWRIKRFQDFESSGDLPSLDDYNQSSIFENLILMFFAPLLSPIFAIWFFYEERKYKLQRLVHTEYRKNMFSKGIIFLSMNLLALSTALLLIIPKTRFWGYPILILTSISAGASIIAIAANIWWQLNWKDFWLDKLLEVIGTASKQNNHDLFNRAMILNGYISSQPDIPIPGSLGFYAIVYSGVQGLLVIVFNTISA